MAKLSPAARSQVELMETRLHAAGKPLAIAPDQQPERTAEVDATGAFRCEGEARPMSEAEKYEFDRLGYLVFRDFLTADEVLDQIRPFAQRTATYLGDVSAAIQDTVSRGRSILFEGAQGTHLDIDHGTYPFVTSSNTVAGNAAAGGGCACKVLDRIVAVVKAYTTRVGSGPFPVELDGQTGTFLQEKGGEFGATTGRPRRCGWLDLVILRESVRLNGPTDIALTKLDVLGGLDEIKLCTSYRYQGKEILYPPQEENSLAQVEPVYESMPGWHEDISGCSDFQSLPQAAQNYVLRVEELLGVPISLVSVGPDRDQTIRR